MKLGKGRQRLFSVCEAAEYIGRTETAVREMVWNEKLPHIRSDRRVMLDIRDLDRWIDQNRVEGSQTTEVNDHACRNNRS